MSRRHALAICAAALAAPAFARAGPVVFAAASLKTVLDELGRSVPMRVSYGGSGALARQVLLGAPAELFLSANPQWMDAAAPRLARPPTVIARGALVVVGRGAPLDLADLVGAGRIAMGFVEAVPAGQYGKAALQHLGLWEALEPQVVQTENVRAALALVARGELPFAVVYATDALAEPSVDILARFPSDSHPPILYQMGVVQGASTQAEAAAAAITEAKALFERHGFLSP